jgi:hypothetical protein
MPDGERLQLALISAGHTNAELTASGLLADTCWPGRIVGAWRDEQTPHRQTLGTHDPERRGRSLPHLRGAPRAGTIPYGLSDTLASSSRDQRAQILLVEGVLDVHILRAHDIQSVTALGGTASNSRLFERLTEVGIEHVVLAFDNDPAGRTATANSIDASVHASRSQDVWVIDPDLIDPAKDPADLISSRGADVWHRASPAPVCGVTWRALDLTGPIVDAGDQLSRRVGLARSATWLGRLPSRLAIEQTSALESVSDRLGYDAAAVRRAFPSALLAPRTRTGNITSAGTHAMRSSQSL